MKKKTMNEKIKFLDKMKSIENERISVSWWCRGYVGHYGPFFPLNVSRAGIEWAYLCRGCWDKEMEKRGELNDKELGKEFPEKPWLHVPWPGDIK